MSAVLGSQFAQNVADMGFCGLFRKHESPSDLLIRTCLGAALIYFGMVALLDKPPQRLAQHALAAIAGIFLLAGLWTPIMGALAALNEISIALALHSPQREETWIHIFLAILAVSVAMLGPGAWSIDARLFGRKRFDIDRTRGRKPSL